MTIELSRISHTRSTKPYPHPVHGAQWNARGWTHGRISHLLEDFTYHWTVQVISSPDELKGWLKNYVAANPDEALPLLVEMLQLVVDSREDKDPRPPS